jgi:hypothetical protein
MDYIRPTPQQNPLLGLLAERLKQAQGFATKPFGYSNPPAEMLMSLLGIPAVQQTMERMAYGEPLTTGRGMTTQVRPEVAEAALTVAPFAPLAGRAAKGVARMAGQEISDVMSGMPSRSLLGDITPKPMQLITYHGTPHRFPPTEKNLLGEFDASKIGTGEGAQSFGYGIYVAENPLVAKDYQLMERNWFDTSKAKYKGKTIDSWYEQAQKDQERAFRTKDSALEKDANARLAYWENIMTHSHPQTVLKQFTDPEFGWDEATKYAKSIDLNKFVGIPETGTLYKVDLPDDKIAKMLDWDKPMAEQKGAIEKMRKALVGPDSPLSRAEQFEINDWLSDKVRLRNLSPQSMVDLKNPKIVEKLREAGIPGIRYLDEGSRVSGKGTSNFVIFPGEEKSLKILERDGEKAPFQFPQQAALDTAQKNAALPISEGGLGLPPNNTPMDRAKAMGFETDVYHATDVPQDFSTFTPSIKGKMGSGVYTSFEPAYAERYAGGEKARTMPLMSRGEMANVDTRTEVSDLVRQQLSNENPNFNIQEWKRLSNQELANRGYSGLDVDKERLVFNPSDLRSRFAAFDPMRRNESDILAGLLPASLLADPETRRKLDEELSLLYTK